MSEQWNKIKQEEKNNNSFEQSIKSIPKAFPTMLKTQKVMKKVKEYHKGNDRPEDVVLKMNQQIVEMGKMLKNDELKLVDDALGDLMLECMNLAGILELNAENFLTNATNKFINRIIDAEHEAVASGTHLL